MICVKCGATLEGSECTLLQCSRDVHIRLNKCTCETCDCDHRTTQKICKSCVQGFHKGRIT